MHQETDGSVGDAFVAPYPLFIHLDDARVIVVGAGEVARRKVETLLSHGARQLTVIAPDVCQEIREYADQGLISLVERPYQQGDLAGALLTVVATDNRAVNEAAYREASEAGQLVNVVDVPELCNAIVPSIVSRGRLQIAISTSGASPTVAKEIRRDLEQRYPACWEEYLDVLAQVRILTKERVPGGPDARMPLNEAVAQAGLLQRIIAGEKLTAQGVWDEIIEPKLAEVR